MTVDGWNRDTLNISITKAGGSENHYVALTETVDISGGEQDVESVATLGGARFVKKSPMSDIEITFEGYALQAGTATAGTAAGFNDLLYGGVNVDASQPLSLSPAANRVKYRVALCWTDDLTATDAAAAIDTTDWAYRIVLADCYCTKVTPSFTDGILKFSVTFKGPPFDTAGTANVLVQSNNGTAAVSAIGAYTTAAKFTST